MNGSRRRRLLFSLSALALFDASAQYLSQFTGTIYVEAAPIQSAGALTGCALNYQAAVLDHQYLKGGLVLIAGSINLNLVHTARGSNVGMLFKIGVRQMTGAATDRTEAPHFAYVQSKNGTTARSVIDSTLSDTPGYKSFAIRLDEPALPLIEDILDGGPLTIGFNRSPDGLDVRVPLDLTVVESKPSGQGIQAVRSQKTVEAFRGCVSGLADAVRGSLR